MRFRPVKPVRLAFEWASLGNFKRPRTPVRERRLPRRGERFNAGDGGAYGQGL